VIKTTNRKLRKAVGANYRGIAAGFVRVTSDMSMHNTAELSMQDLSKYFKMPEKAVAKTLGICLTSLKKICRQNGINRWPYRKVHQAPLPLLFASARACHLPILPTRSLVYGARVFDLGMELVVPSQRPRCSDQTQ